SPPARHRPRLTPAPGRGTARGPGRFSLATGRTPQYLWGDPLRRWAARPPPARPPGRRRAGWAPGPRPRPRTFPVPSVRRRPPVRRSRRLPTATEFCRMAGAFQDKLSRVRKPRVHITYEVETNGAMEIKELPFVVGVMAALSGHRPEGELGPLKDRKFVEID